MWALVERKRSVATLLPTHVVSMLTSFACFDVSTTSSQIELHANWFGITVTKTNATPLRNGDLALALLATCFGLMLSFAFGCLCGIRLVSSRCT